jgi:N-carbamoylputrescine amidase
MRVVSIAATQFSCSWDRDANVGKAKGMVREATARGANVVLLPEFFETPYFCQDQRADYFRLARPFRDNPLIKEMSELAKALGVVLPVSFFEKAGHSHFNSLAMIDADGTVLGIYRKSHIPDGPGYQEKFYFTPGDTGFQVWSTRFGMLGCAVCWDQWFPEAARAMSLMGAEILLYPTAIGTEPPPAPPVDSRDHWHRVMQGHAAANYVPLVASNRTGREAGDKGEMTFYGSSFIADPTGAIVAQLGRDEEGVAVHPFDLDEVARMRASWGLFRDRRPDLYGQLARHPGATS